MMMIIMLISSMSLSPDGSYVLTNSMDNTLRIWDVRPFVQGERCVKVITGLYILLMNTFSPLGKKLVYFIIIILNYLFSKHRNIFRVKDCFKSYIIRQNIIGMDVLVIKFTYQYI